MFLLIDIIAAGSLTRCKLSTFAVWLVRYVPLMFTFEWKFRLDSKDFQDSYYEKV